MYIGVSRIHRKWERKVGTGTTYGKYLMEGYHVDIQVMLYSMMLLCDDIVGPFCTVSLKGLKLSNRAVTICLNAITEFLLAIANYSLNSSTVPLTTISIEKFNTWTSV